MKQLIKQAAAKFKSLLRNIVTQLKDKTNLIIFFIVFAVLSSEVWVPYLIAIITGNKWWWAVGSACWAFWLAPFTPFLPLCLFVTFCVRKIYDKIKNNKGEK